jgi:hypothetical protein
MIPMTRPQRVDLLVRRKAPLTLVRNEVQLAVREYMDQDIKLGLYRGPMHWVMAAWSLVAALTEERAARLRAEKQMRLLRKELKAREAVA